MTPSSIRTPLSCSSNRGTVRYLISRNRDYYSDTMGKYRGRDYNSCTGFNTVVGNIRLAGVSVSVIDRAVRMNRANDHKHHNSCGVGYCRQRGTFHIGGKGPMDSIARASFSSSERTSEETRPSLPPFGVIVEAVIDPNRVTEFLQLIEINAAESRKEPGCIRFDVLRSQDSPNKFYFYELYENTQALEYHKKQAHYNLWAEFKASGGAISSVSYKMDGEFLTK